MKRKGLSGLIFVLSFLPLVFIGCPMDAPGVTNGNGDITVPPTLDPWEPPATGIRSAERPGFGMLSGYYPPTEPEYTPVVMTVVMEEGFISSVSFFGPGESPGHIGNLPSLMTAQMVARNTYYVRPYVSAISGSTMTADAIMDATRAAIEMILADYAAAHTLSLSVDKDTLNLLRTDTASLAAVVTPAGTGLTWTSSDTSIVTVYPASGEEVEVRAVAPGMAVITVTTGMVDGETDEARVFVFVF